MECEQCSGFDVGINEQTLFNLSIFTRYGFESDYDTGMPFMHDKNSGSIGVAYYDGLCNDVLKYGILAHFQQGWKQRNLFAHELAHFFDAQHTNNTGLTYIIGSSIRYPKK